MSAPDPEGMSLLAKVVTAGAAIIGPVVGGIVWIEKRFAKNEMVDKEFMEVKEELTVQRGHIAKIFDQMRDAELHSESRHREILMHLLEKK